MIKNGFKRVIICIIMFSALFLMGCNKLENTKWKLTDITSNASGKTDEKLDISLIKSLLVENYKIEFKDNGKVTVTISNKSEDGTFNQNGSKLTINLDDDPINGEIKDSKLYFTSPADSSFTLIFEII